MFNNNSEYIFNKCGKLFILLGKLNYLLHKKKSSTFNGNSESIFKKHYSEALLHINNINNINCCCCLLLFVYCRKLQFVQWIIDLHTLQTESTEIKRVSRFICNVYSETNYT